MGVFAEFERAMIVERVNTGPALARAQRKRLGRPTKLNSARERCIREMLADGVGMIKIGKTVEFGTGTIQKIRAAMERADAGVAAGMAVFHPLIMAALAESCSG